MALHETIADGIATVVMAKPPVNALDIADGYAMADLLDGYRRNPDVRAVVLCAEGQGSVTYTHLTLPTTPYV